MKKDFVDTKNEILTNIIKHINTVMGYIDLFEENRPATIVIERLEEAVMWSQVMIANVKLKNNVIENIEVLENENKEKVLKEDVA